MKTESIETFHPLGQYEITKMKQTEPSCFNGFVRVKRYRVTVEEIEEPVDVLGERLQKLWDECNNHHHWTPLQNEANKIGYKLKGSAGSNKK